MGRLGGLLGHLGRLLPQRCEQVARRAVRGPSLGLQDGSKNRSKWGPKPIKQLVYVVIDSYIGFESHLRGSEGRLGAELGRLEAILGRLGAVLGLSGGILGRPGRSWGRLEAVLEPSWGRLGAVWRGPGAS